MRIALHGIPGSGKSTLARMLVPELERAGVPSVVLRLADPLYALQALVYRTAGRPLPDPTVQDGRLLADLAGHLRRINPDALTGDFRARVHEVSSARPGAAIVCDDVRPADAVCLVGLGFMLVRVDADAELRAARLAGRGDLTAGCGEQAVDVAHQEIRNDGSLEDLRVAARELVA
jgi:hypothetical protein